MKKLLPLLALLPLAACNYDVSSWYRPQVSWTVATEREPVNGISAPLSPAEIAGHRIYWGYSSGNHPYTYWTPELQDNFNVQSFSNPTADLSKTIYMVVRTVDTRGVESLDSTEVMQ